MGGDEYPAGDRGHHQGQHHKKGHGQDQGLIVDRHPGNAEQKTDDGDEQHQHKQVIDRYLHQGIGRIAVSKVTPDKDHGRAGSGGQDDGPGHELLGLVRCDPVRENSFEKKHGEQEHGKGLDQPVDKQDDEKPPGISSHLQDRTEIDLQHHRKDHQPDQHNNWDVDMAALGKFHGGKRRGDPGKKFPEHDTGNHADRHPDGEIPFKNIHPF